MHKKGDVTPKTDAGASPQENTIGEEFKELPVEEQLANIALQSQRAGNVAGLLDSFPPVGERRSTPLPTIRHQ